MRILLDGGQAYVFAVANCNSHYEKMLVEAPTEVREAPDGNGDTLIYADGTQAETGGGVMPFTKTDAEYMTAMRQADAAPAADLLPGWKENKLSLKACPNGKRPGVFAYGRVAYTVPGGDAWEAVCRLIEAGAFDGHGLPMKTPGDLFRRGHRAFFSERMGRNESGWYLKTR
ncbi:MAG: hypothetical protein BWY37_02236 [Firmicutes bacterium ADurb.Bin262]|nr:MAG: hypothetical protein BWY37_02236 [Firmicutes bacterium ADurb.Bin262]